jgi:Na+/citrate or Na+/malate symporter
VVNYSQQGMIPMKPLSDDLRYTVNGMIVGSLNGVIISLLIPMNYLPSHDAYFPLLAIGLVVGAIMGMVIGIVIGMVIGLLRRWRT